MIEWLPLPKDEQRDIRFLLIPEYAAESFTTYSLYLGHLFVRFSPFRGLGQPYLEFLLGFNYFESEISIEPGYYPLLRSREIERDVSDWATSLGLGAGMSLRLASLKPTNDHSQVNLGLDIKFRYLISGSTRYLKEVKGIDLPRGLPIIQTTETRTDMLTGTISLVFWF